MILERISLLPDDLIREIYQYIRVLPFDKKEFIHYYENNVLKYQIRPNRFNETAFFFEEWNKASLIGRNKKGKITKFIVIIDTPFIFQYIDGLYTHIKTIKRYYLIRDWSCATL
tara:strand:+ start:479 stop:820 length:342 start_codon:yes stop_codon:yes gene_type:complete